MVTYLSMLLKAQGWLSRRFPPETLARVPGALRARKRIRRFMILHLVPDGRSWVQVQHGFAKGVWMELDMVMERSWCAGNHEPGIQDALQKFLPERAVMYDVGAHIGFHALPAARAGFHVVAFEPDPENAARLRNHARRNQLHDSIQVVEAAAWSNASSSIPFRRGLPRSQGGVCWRDRSPVLASGEVTAVPALRLDDFVANGGPAPHIMKIDVEGAESEVLKGASEILRRHHPALIVEVHTASELDIVSKLLQAFCYSTRWDTPPEGFPRTCFASPATNPRTPAHSSRT